MGWGNLERSIRLINDGHSEVGVVAGEQCNDSVLKYLRDFGRITQVGSPAVRLRLARCMAWVKRWSEAMDFLQTIFKTNISLSGIFENYIIKG